MLSHPHLFVGLWGAGVSGGEYKGLLENHALKEGDEIDLGRVEYRQDGAAQTRMVLAWPRGNDEPLYLATNLTRSLRKVVSAYRERRQEEESFRDMKSQGLAAAARGLDRGLSTASNRRRDLSLTRIGAMLLQRALGPPEALLAFLTHTPI